MSLQPAKEITQEKMKQSSLKSVVMWSRWTRKDFCHCFSVNEKWRKKLAIQLKHTHKKKSLVPLVRMMWKLHTADGEFKVVSRFRKKSGKFLKGQLTGDRQLPKLVTVKRWGNSGGGSTLWLSRFWPLFFKYVSSCCQRQNTELISTVFCWNSFVEIVLLDCDGSLSALHPPEMFPAIPMCFWSSAPSDRSAEGQHLSDVFGWQWEAHDAWSCNKCTQWSVRKITFFFFFLQVHSSRLYSSRLYSSSICED